MVFTICQRSKRFLTGHRTLSFKLILNTLHWLMLNNVSQVVVTSSQNCPVGSILFQFVLMAWRIEINLYKAQRFSRIFVTCMHTARVAVRYGWPIPDLATLVLVSGESFDPDHALLCPHAWFTIGRHDHLRNLFAEMLKKVCSEVAIELNPRSFPSQERPSIWNPPSKARGLGQT